jgi:hypothetical protein
MLRYFVLNIVFTLVLFSSASAQACSYADDSSPLQAYIDSSLIFVGRVEDRGIEVENKKSFNFILLHVDEFIKGRFARSIRVYTEKNVEELPLGAKGLIVAFEGVDGKPFITDCTRPYFDQSLPPGKSLYDLHKSILRKLHLVMLLTAVFSGFMMFLYIKGKSLPGDISQIP